MKIFKNQTELNLIPWPVHVKLMWVSQPQNQKWLLAYGQCYIIFNISCQKFHNKKYQCRIKILKFKPRYYNIIIKFAPHDGDALHVALGIFLHERWKIYIYF
jgi:hypothetical protein